MSRWYLSDKVGDGWMILAEGSGDMRDDFIETVYKKDIGDQIVNEHNAIERFKDLSSSLRNRSESAPPVLTSMIHLILKEEGLDDT